MKHLVGLIGLSILLGIVQGGCTAPQAGPPSQPISVTVEPCPWYAVGAEQPTYPDYILSAWPPPRSENSLACYNQLRGYLSSTKGIGGMLDVAEVDSFQSGKPLPLSRRVKLLLDKEPVQTTEFYVEELGQLVRENEQGEPIPVDSPQLLQVTRVPKLPPGKHQATLIVTRDTGEELEYNWEFAITP